MSKVWAVITGCEDAKDKAGAKAKVKIDKFLAGEQAARIVNSWPDWKKNIGHALQPPTPD